MRVLLCVLGLAVPACFAQTMPQANKPCAAARIVKPSGSYPMPVVKTPQVRDGVVSTAPACGEPVPQMAKTIVVPRGIPIRPGKYELMPNPFAPYTQPRN